MKNLLKLISQNNAVKILKEGSGNIVAGYLYDEALMISSAFLESKKTYFVIKNNLYEAQQLYNSLKVILEDECCFFPMDESMRMEILAQSPEMLAERLSTYEMLQDHQPCVVVTSTQAVMRHIPTPATYQKAKLHIQVGMQLDMKELQKRLSDLGYQYITSVDQPFYFSHRGGIVDVFSINYEHPIRIEFFDDEVDSIRLFDEQTQRTIESRNEVTLIPASEMIYFDSEIDKAIKSLEGIYQKYITRLNVDLQDQLHHYFQMDMDKIKSHEVSPELNKYYHYFGHDCSIVDYCKDAIIVLASPSGIKENERMMHEEIHSYQLEMFDEGRMIRGLDIVQDVNKAICKHYQVVSIENFQTSGKEIIFNSRQVDPFFKQEAEDIAKELRKLMDGNKVILVLSSEALVRKFSEMCFEYHISINRYKQGEALLPGITLYQSKMEQGIELGDERIIILTEKELFGRVTFKKPTFVKYKNAKILRNFDELQKGDYVVHDSHGIGQYVGIETKEINGVHRDYLRIAYRGDDVLFLPVDQFKMIRKYTSKEGRVPKINKLGTTEWAKTKQKIKKKTDDLAEKLIDIYAKRMASVGFAFEPDNSYQEEFEESFGFELTRDQQRATQEVKMDMESSRPMDRLLCGDVGFGKTEVALRAAFKAVSSQKQVAFLCPTTILSSQHYKTAKERFKDFPVEIAVLNRYVSAKQTKEILQKLKDGKIDILIGTHRILSQDVVFKDIGLLIIDEEQRFGVKHKERIKELKETVDVLTLTATPIPRTLQMSLMGIRGLSTINTPPKNRFPVSTFVIEKSNSMIKQVIERELARNGQVFYLHNRTDDINSVAVKLHEMIPTARIAVGHGQMTKDALEDVMNKFIEKEFDILVCTTIIETGIDIPNANTIIVEEADHFGLSQLYQIKGRVGRSNRHAYAYLLHRPDKQMTPEATKRLKAIKEFTQLGSGYKIAMRDLNIRGAGDILGGEQAGFIDTVGFDMFMRILQESIDEKTGKQKEEVKEVESKAISVDGYIPENYVNSDLEKLRLYQQLQTVNTLKELDETKEEFKDIYGKLPHSVSNLVEKRELDILSDNPLISEVKEDMDLIHVIFTKEDSTRIDGIKLMDFITQIDKSIKVSYVQSRVDVKFNKEGDYLKQMNIFLRGMNGFFR